MKTASAMLAFVLLWACWAAGCVAAETGKREAISSGKAAAFDPSVVRAELRDILSQPEYNRRYVTENPFSEKLGAALERVVKWLVELFRPDLDRGPGRLTTFVLAWLTVGGFTVLAAYIMFRFVRRGPGTDPDEQGPSETVPGGFDPAHLLEMAARLVREQDCRGAFRCAYLACIAALDHAGALRFHPSRTNWEHLSELAAGGRDSEYALLKPLTERFDRVFYGRGECETGDYLAAAEAFRRLVPNARAG